MNTLHVVQKETNSQVVAEVRSKLSLPSYAQSKYTPNSSFHM